MTATLQRKLPLADATLCPVLTISGVRSELPGHDEDDVLALIEEGALEFAWNIALRVGDGIRREPIVLKKCVAHYLASGGARPLNWTDARAFKEFFNGDEKPFIYGTTLKLLWNCSGTHIIALIEARELKVQPGTTWDRGPGNSPVITRASVEGFLKRRRMI